jgi:hypothetical protein
MLAMSGVAEIESLAAMSSPVENGVCPAEDRLRLERLGFAPHFAAHDSVQIFPQRENDGDPKSICGGSDLETTRVSPFWLGLDADEKKPIRRFGLKGKRVPYPSLVSIEEDGQSVVLGNMDRKAAAFPLLVLAGGPQFRPQAFNVNLVGFQEGEEGDPEGDVADGRAETGNKSKTAEEENKKGNPAFESFCGNSPRRHCISTSRSWGRSGISGPEGGRRKSGSYGH